MAAMDSTASPTCSTDSWGSSFRYVNNPKNDKHGGRSFRAARLALLLKLLHHQVAAGGPERRHLPETDPATASTLAAYAHSKRHSPLTKNVSEGPPFSTSSRYSPPRRDPGKKGEGNPRQARARSPGEGVEK